MSLLPSKTQIINALSNTQAEAQQSAKCTEFLIQSSKSAGYTMLLIKIFDEEDLHIQTRYNILVELRKHIRSYWNVRNSQITAQQKQQIKESIIPSFIRCPPSHILIKTYKEILVSIISYQYRNWHITTYGLQQIRKGQKIHQYLQLLLAIASAFQFSITEQEKTHFYDLIAAVLPVLLQRLNRENNNSQLVYFSIKFLWKAVHYQISPAIKDLTFEWMPLLQRIVGSVNPKYDNNLSQIQQKGSEQFYYLHSKKWATRILLRFIQKHAKKRLYNRNQDNRQFSQKWYAEFGDNFIPILIQQFSVNTTKKNRFFQLKCMNTIILEHAEKVKQYSQIFQYDILLNFLRLSPQDEDLALKQPTKFIQKQKEPCSTFTQFKFPATDIWIGFLELGSKSQKRGQQYQPGTYFFQNLDYLKGKLQENNQKQIELILYLISSINRVVKKCRSVHHIMEKMIIKHVIPKFKSPNICIRARALEVFANYNFINYDNIAIQQAVQAICHCILKEEHNLVRLKAISAYSFVTIYQNAKIYALPFLNQVLDSALQLMQYLGQQSTGGDFSTMIKNFSSQISTLAYSIICRLHKIYLKMVKKDNQMKNQHQYNSQACFLAARCLKLAKQIIQSSLDQDIIRQTQSQVLSIFQSAFMAKQNDFIDDSLVILETFILKVEVVSQMAWKFYQFIIFNIVGTPKCKQYQINKILEQKNCNYSKSRIKDGDIEMFERSYPVLRNYIHKISLMTSQPNYNSYKNQLISLLFHLINEVYKKGIQYQTGKLNIYLSTSLMINLIQYFKKSLPTNIYLQIWQFVRINLRSFRSRKLSYINSQLLGLLLWTSPLDTLTVAKRQNMLQSIIAQITNKIYEHEYQRARLILGINSVLSLSQKPSFIIPKILDLFKTNIKLIKKNINKRHKTQPIITQENSAILDQNQSDDYQDYQLYDNSSSLNMTDEISQFGQILSRLSIEQDDLYQSLSNSVEDNITELRQTIQMVKRKNK